MRSIRTVKSSGRKLSRALQLKRFKSRPIKACVTENPTGCHKRRCKIANPFSCVHYCNDLEEAGMTKMKGELPRVTVGLITGHMPLILKFPFEQQRLFGAVYC